MRKILLILSLIITLSFCACTNTFKGTKTKKENLYQLEIIKMTGTDTHKMNLKKGNILDIFFKKEFGKLNMKIKTSDGTVIYDGNGTSLPNFSININDDGVYSIVIDAKNAKGEIKVVSKGK